MAADRPAAANRGEAWEKLMNAPVAFGLRAQGHLPTVERMLAEGSTWDEIGREIGWTGNAVRESYEIIEADRGA